MLNGTIRNILNVLLNLVGNTTDQVQDLLSNLLGTQVTLINNNTVICLASNVTNALGRILDGLLGSLGDLDLSGLTSGLGDTISGLLG